MSGQMPPYDTPHLQPPQQQLIRRAAVQHAQQQPQQQGALELQARRGGMDGGDGNGGRLPPVDALAHTAHIPHRLVLDAASHKLVLPSRAALWAVLTVPLALWWGCVAVGVLHWEPEFPGGLTRREFEHPLTWFDVHVFRVWGPLLPLLPFALRIAAIGSAAWAAKPRRPPTFSSPAAAAAASGARLPSPPLPPVSPLRPGPSLPGQCAAAYALLIGGRVGLYACHLWLQASHELYLVSDHLLLAASVVACFQVELACCLSDVWKAELLRHRDPAVTGPRQIAVIACLVVSAFTLVFLYGDMYCTARWYHEPPESLAALAAGAALFNGPVVLWLWREAGR